MARLLARPMSFFCADLSGETGVSSVILGGADGSARLLGSDAFDAGRIMEPPDRGTRAEDLYSLTSWL